MFDPKKLREKRESLRLSATKLAKILKVKPGSIYKWEGGTKPSNFEELQKVESWLNGTPIPKATIDWERKYYELLEKYTAELEKRNN